MLVTNQQPSCGALIKSNRHIGGAKFKHNNRGAERGPG